MRSFTITTRAASRTLPHVLYAVAFLLQLVGGILIVWEIVDDEQRAATLKRNLPAKYDDLDETLKGLVDSLSGHRWRRVVGAVLFFVGALVAFAANLTALQ